MSRNWFGILPFVALTSLFHLSSLNHKLKVTWNRVHSLDIVSFLPSHGSLASLASLPCHDTNTRATMTSCGEYIIMYTFFSACRCFINTGYYSSSILVPRRLHQLNDFLISQLHMDLNVKLDSNLNVKLRFGLGSQILGLKMFYTCNNLCLSNVQICKPPSIFAILSLQDSSEN